MALTAKKQKKIYHWIYGADDKFNKVFTDLCIQYFVVFCFALMFDRVAEMMSWRYQPELGYGQVAICIGCIVQMVRYSRMIKR